METTTNAYQQKLAGAYPTGGGTHDFAYMADIKSESEFRSEAQNNGDTLFTFLAIELSTSEDCDSAAEAIRRIAKAEKQLARVRERIEHSED